MKNIQYTDTINIKLGSFGTTVLLQFKDLDFEYFTTLEDLPKSIRKVFNESLTSSITVKALFQIKNGCVKFKKLFTF